MNTKKKGGKKGASRNSASVKQSRPAANKSVSRPTQNGVQHTKKRGGRKHNGGAWGWFANIGRTGIGVKTVIGATGGLFVGEAAAAALPQSPVGDLALLIGGGFGVAWLLSMFSLTKDYAVGAGIGVGAVGGKNLLNRLSGNAVGNFFLSAASQARGYLQPAPQPQTNGDTSAGVAGFYPRRVAQVW